jgi:flavodoxin
MQAFKELTMQTGLIVYSSRTGNTERVARAVHEALAGKHDLCAITDAPDPSPYDWILIGFWVNRGTADEETLDYLARIRGKHVGFFATLGAYPDSQHARDVVDRFSALVSESNTLIGSFICQGRIDPKLTEKFRSFPPDHPHAMTPERVKRHRDAASHPDAQDLRNAAEACKQMLAVSELR